MKNFNGHLKILSLGWLYLTHLQSLKQFQVTGNLNYVHADLKVHTNIANGEKKKTQNNAICITPVYLKNVFVSFYDNKQRLLNTSL